MKTIVIFVVLVVISSCSTAPDGYVNNERYLYLKGDNKNSSLVITNTMLSQTYSIGVEDLCEMLISRINGQFVGWNGVYYAEIPAGKINFTVGNSNGYYAPGMMLDTASRKVYTISCDYEKAWFTELNDSEYIPSKREFIYQGVNYKLPI